MLRFSDVSSGYGDTEILKGLSFDIKRGGFVGIIGPNGSGKSTLLRTATKVLKPFKGEVYLEEKRLEDISLKEMSQKVAVVSQDDLFAAVGKLTGVRSQGTGKARLTSELSRVRGHD